MEHLLISLEKFNCETPLQKLFCNSCPFRSHFVANLYNHVCSSPKKEIEFRAKKCAYCHFRTHSMVILIRHQRKCLESQATMCQNDYRIESAENKNRFECARCDFHTKFRGNMVRHIRRNCSVRKSKGMNRKFKTGQWFECDKCPFRTKRSGNFNIHKMAKHTASENKKWLQCEHCAFKTVHKTSLNKHVARKHADFDKAEWFECTQCSYITRFSYQLKLHIEKVHEKNGRSRRTATLNFRKFDITSHSHIQGNVHKCKKCSYFTKSIFFMRNHINRHKTKAGLFSCERNRPEAFFCHDCKFSTNLITCFNQHIQDTHLKTRSEGPKFTLTKFECKKCEFQTYCSLLVRHSCRSSKKQTVGQWYQCDHCHFKTRQAFFFEQHLNLKHTSPEQARWFQCDYCAYKTKKKDTLRRHIGVLHEKSDQYLLRCDYCEFTSYYLHGLRGHVDSQHKDLDIGLLKCGSCEFTSKARVIFERHRCSVYRRA